MNSKTLSVSKRILQQLKNDPRFVVLSIVAPVIIIFLFSVTFDVFPEQFPAERYIMPITALVVHFLGFLLSMLILVQERINGTLERMLVNGFKQFEIIIGYLLGYLVLITFQTFVSISLTMYLFELDYSTEQLIHFVAVTWILSLCSVSLGLFLSSLAKKVAHVIPFVPLVLIPSIFLSGLMVNYDLLPEWAQIIGKIAPLYYANEIIQSVIQNDFAMSEFSFSMNYLVLVGLIFGFVILAANSMRDEIV